MAEDKYIVLKKISTYKYIVPKDIFEEVEAFEIEYVDDLPLLQLSIKQNELTMVSIMPIEDECSQDIFHDDEDDEIDFWKCEGINYTKEDIVEQIEYVDLTTPSL